MFGLNSIIYVVLLKQNLINFVRYRNSVKDFDVNNVRFISGVIVGRNSGKDFDVNNVQYISCVTFGFWCRLMMIALYPKAKPY